jgi:hypothetical protein
MQPLPRLLRYCRMISRQPLHGSDRDRPDSDDAAAGAVSTRHDAGAQYDSDSMPALQRFAVEGSDHWPGAAATAAAIARLRPPRQPLRRPPGERVEGSDRRRRRALAGGGDSSQVEGRDRRWRRAIAGEGIMGREQICDSGSGDRDSDRDCSPPVTQAAAATVTSQPELTSW